MIPGKSTGVLYVMLAEYKALDVCFESVNGCRAPYPPMDLWLIKLPTDCLTGVKYRE